MLNAEAVILGELEQLSPLPSGAVADWQDVLRRANALAQANLVLAGPRFRERRWPTLRLPARRRLVVTVAVLAAVLIPLVALGAVNNWWFFRSGIAPAPVSGPVIVKEGNWDGHSWQLIAYPSTTDGLCFAITPTNSKGNLSGGGLSCAPFVGIARTAHTKASPELTVTWMSSSGGSLPPYIAGPVIKSATQVEIQFTSGDRIRIRTFPAPEPLTAVRFYASRLPATVVHFLHATRPSPQHPEVQPPVKRLTGIDSHGKIVACLVPATNSTALSDCR